MPNPNPARFSGHGSNARYFEVRSSDGAFYLWKSPPSILNRLLGELFTNQPEDVLSWVHLAIWQMRGEGHVDSKDAWMLRSSALSTRASQKNSFEKNSWVDVVEGSSSTGNGGFRSLFMQTAKSQMSMPSSPSNGFESVRSIGASLSTGSDKALGASLSTGSTASHEDGMGVEGSDDAFVLCVTKHGTGQKTPSARPTTRPTRSRSNSKSAMETVPEDLEEEEYSMEVPEELGNDCSLHEGHESLDTDVSASAITGSVYEHTFSALRTDSENYYRRATSSQDILSIHKAAAKRAASNLSSLSDVQSSEPSSIMQDVFQKTVSPEIDNSKDCDQIVATQDMSSTRGTTTSFVTSLTRRVKTTMGARLGLRVAMFGERNRSNSSQDVSKKVERPHYQSRFRASTISAASEDDVVQQSWMGNFVYTHSPFSAEAVTSEGLPMPPGSCVALLPSARRQLIWDLVFSISLFFDAWATPFALTYLPNPSAQPQWLDMLFTIVLIVFCIDIVHNFFVGYVRNSVVVLSLGEAAAHYLMTWFTVDVVATLPHLLWLCLENGQSSIRWITLVRLIRIGRVHQWMRRLPAMLELNWHLEHLHGFLHFQGAVILVAHFNSVWLASVQPKSWVAGTTQEAFRHYLWCLWRSISILTCSGDAPVSDQEGEWLLSMLISLERSILFFMIVSVLAWAQIKNIGHYDFAQDALQEKLLAYVRRARVPVPLQMELTRVLNVYSKVRGQQQHFDALEAQELPRHLRATICRELWGHRLGTFSLLHEIMYWNAELAQELVMLVRDMYFAPNSKIYTAGEVSYAAYLVITGRLASSDLTIMNWLPGMWVGEKAFVNPELRRTETVFTKERTELMGVPANELRKLLISFDLLPRFEGLLQKKLWKGLCGRCGTLGDHFEAECPLLLRRSVLIRSRFSDTLVSKSSTTTKASLAFDKDFADFIDQHDMDHLRPLFLRFTVHSLDDVTRDVVEMMVKDKEYQLSELAAGVLYAAASKFKKKLKRSCTQLLSTPFDASVNAATHLIFISHNKNEAGTEAALIQKDLEKLLAEDPNLADLGSPVFLDTEDLRDLTDLQAHVERSHNMLLLLTQNVLLRPWVLVEIVTACRVDTKIVLVEIQRRDVTYNFPSEEFFTGLKNGTALDLGAYGLLKDQNITIDELVSTLRTVFQRIALPFSPHKTANVRQAELMDILKNCKMTDKMVFSSPSISPHRSGSTHLVRYGTKDLFGNSRMPLAHSKTNSC